MSRNILELKKIYLARRRMIKDRLAEFRRKLSSPSEEIFKELCFCLLTPQSKAKLCWKAIENLCDKKLLPASSCNRPVSSNHIAECLVGVRFPKNKSRYVLQAIQQHYKDICGMDGEHSVKKLSDANLNQILDYREYLVKNITGYGYKEASHFLRNVGLGKNIAILDRHILKNLIRYGAIKEIPPTLTRKNYLEIENKMREFSKKIKIPMDELDLLFWSMETGEIFK